MKALFSQLKSASTITVLLLLLCWTATTMSSLLREAEAVPCHTWTAIRSGNFSCIPVSSASSAPSPNSNSFQQIKASIAQGNSRSMDVPRDEKVTSSTITPTCTASNGNVVFQETYEAGLDQWHKNGGCYDYSFSTVNDPAGGNNRVVRIINRMGEDNRTCKGGEGKKINNGYKRRAELMPESKATRARYKESHWVSERIFIPSNWPKEQPSEIMTISQIIAAFPGMQGTDMKLRITRKQRWIIEVRTAIKGWKNIDVGPITRGVWTSWVFHYKRSKDPDGIAQVWLDGKLVVDYQGPTTYNDHPDAIWKHGIYVSDADNGEEYILYFDDVKVAQGPNQYAAIHSSCSK